MRVISSSLVAALLAGVAAVPAAAADSVPVRLIVGLTEGADPTAVVGDIGPWRAVAGLHAITVDVPSGGEAAAFAKWATDPAVRYSTRDSTVHADGDPGDADNLYDLNLVQVPGAWTWTTGSPSVRVAVVDTGIVPTADLAVDRIDPGYDFVDGDANPADDDGHGTVLANAIAAQGGNGVGVTGICGQCRIMPVRALRHTTSYTPAIGYSSDVAAGIVWAADHGARIVNVSASTDAAVPLLQEAVDHAASKDVLVMASAGHWDKSLGTPPTTRYIGYPAAFEDALAIGSAGQVGYPNDSSNGNTPTNRWVDVSAAGSVGALGLAGKIRALFGTSASTPIVSGVAALAYAMKPGLTAADARKLIIESATPIDGTVDPPMLDAARLMHVGLGAPDTVAPVVTDDRNVTNGMWIGKTINFYFAPVASDDHAIARMDFFINGQLVNRTNPLSGPPLFGNPYGLRDGAYPVTTRVYDYAGHMGERTVTVNFDTKPPVGKIDYPLPGLRIRTGPVKVIFSSPDRDNLTSVVVNGAVATHAAGSTTWTAAVIPYPGDGLLTVRAIDRAGNETTWTRIVRVIP